MTIQDLLAMQRSLKKTQPDLRTGSHDWWDAMREKIKNETQM